MSNYAVLSRFQRSILYVARVSGGVVPYLATAGSGAVRESVLGRIEISTGGHFAWIKEDALGRLSINPDLSGGRAYEDSSGRLFVNTSAGLAPFPGSQGAIYPDDVLYPSDTLYPSG